MRLGDAKRPAAAQYPCGLALDQRRLVFLGAVEVDDLALRLRHHLAGHDDEVSVFERQSRCIKRLEEHRNEIVTLFHHRDRRQGNDAQFVHASTAALSRRAFSGSAMIVVVTTTSTPRLRTASARVASASSMIHVPISPL